VRESYWNRYWRNRLCGRGLDSAGSGWGQVVDCCDHFNEPSGYI